MADENRLLKYMRYAIGEIVLVVAGILIALQINNWNEANKQKHELNDILQSIANGVESDLRELDLLSSARANIVSKTDSIFKKYITSDKSTVNIEEASYINFAFNNILNTVHLNTNTSAFESLKNSSYFGKIQGTDLALLLNTYFKTAERIRGMENEHNQTIKNLEQEWLSQFRNNGVRLFLEPWRAGDFAIVGPRFLEIARDAHTMFLWARGSGEGGAIKVYQEQALMGTKLVEMIRNSKTKFDQQTELEFSGILFTFGEADIISVLINGEISTGFDIRYAASGLFPNYVSQEKDYLVIEYPANRYDWASAYFAVNALSGRVDEMDLSDYSKIVVEMKAETEGAAFEIGMKDINDPADGSETRIKTELTEEWKVYEFETKDFVTADLERITVLLAFVFEGPVARKIHIRTVQLK